KTRWEGIDCYNYSPLIYAYNEHNIAITGEGILDGQADTSNWWKWKGKPEYGWKKGMPSQLDSAGRPRLMKLNEQETDPEARYFGEGGYLRPPFIQFFQCNGILIEDITIRNSPFWLIHPLLSENIIIRKIHAISHGPNNDGIDPESCRNVIIHDCFFDTGDDCIAIKSGRDHDGRKWNRMSENILIIACRMKNGHGGVSIGSEVSGGCRNVVVDSCKMDSPELERALRIKTNSLRGGIIENIYFSNIYVGEVKESVLDIDCQYEVKSGSSGVFPPVIRNIFLTNITSRKSRYALFFRGIPGYISLDQIVINNAFFNGVQKGNFLENTGNIRLEKVYINGSEFSLPATTYHKIP
ncbi:MAG: glycoside hydrolase family 28 protein, partial [Veillonellaceae bacterium]|nr:glycoside hydrolase family 28 protein [Veillonellaceae bacterium]